MSADKGLKAELESKVQDAYMQVTMYSLLVGARHLTDNLRTQRFAFPDLRSDFDAGPGRPRDRLASAAVQLIRVYSQT